MIGCACGAGCLGGSVEIRKAGRQERRGSSASYKGHEASGTNCRITCGSGRANEQANGDVNTTKSAEITIKRRVVGEDEPQRAQNAQMGSRALSAW